MNPDDFVGGRNFGGGASRGHAPAIVERVGVSAVIAASVARLIYRNAVDVCLSIITCDTSQIEEGDGLHVGLLDGGLKPHVQTRGTLGLE